MGQGVIIHGTNQVHKGATLTESGSQRALDVNDISGGGGGGSTGGGLSTYYAKPSGTNADATSAYASATTLTVTGLPFTFTEYDIVSIRQIPNSGGSGAQDTTFTDIADFSVSGTTITVSGASFAATDEFIVAFALPPKGVDEANDSQVVESINGPETRYVGETLADVTNETNATNNRYVDMDGYNNIAIQFEKTGGTDTVTLTVEATLQDDGTAAASCTYQDVTQYSFSAVQGGTDAASYTADNMLVMKDRINYKYLNIKTVSSGGTNDADYAIYIKRWYA